MHTGCTHQACSRNNLSRSSHLHHTRGRLRARRRASDAPCPKEPVTLHSLPRNAKRKKRLLVFLSHFNLLFFGIEIMSSFRSPKNDLEMLRNMLLDRRAKVVQQTRREVEEDQLLRKERDAIRREIQEVDKQLRKRSQNPEKAPSSAPKLSPRSRSARDEYNKKRRSKSRVCKVQSMLAHTHTLNTVANTRSCTSFALHEALFPQTQPEEGQG